MGQDFIEKRNERCTRLQELHYERQFKERDLFSDIPPTEETQLVGCLVEEEEVLTGDELWHEAGNGDCDELAFFKGGKLVVRLSGEPADKICELEERHKVPINLRVSGVDKDVGAVQLVPLEPNGVG